MGEFTLSDTGRNKLSLSAKKECCYRFLLSKIHKHNLLAHKLVWTDWISGRVKRRGHLTYFAWCVARCKIFKIFDAAASSSHTCDLPFKISLKVSTVSRSAVPMATVTNQYVADWPTYLIVLCPVTAKLRRLDTNGLEHTQCFPFASDFIDKLLVCLPSLRTRDGRSSRQNFGWR